MEVIFHEQQEGSLCAQHCLNALLQGPYFSPVDLADIAKQLDECEREHMAVAGEATDEYRRFLQEPSSNLDDSGFFSVQVIERALEVWGLGLMQLNSSDEIAISARKDPTTGKAYICNFRGHWLTIRKIGYQWFNLNSLLVGPELVSDTYLSLFLKQLQEEGYSIFIVKGDLPECEADLVLCRTPVTQKIKPRLINENTSISQQADEESEEYKMALEESRKEDEREDQALQRVLKESMQGYIWEPFEAEKKPPTSSAPEAVKADMNTPLNEKPDQDEIRKKRLAFLRKDEPSQNAVFTKGAKSTKSAESALDSSDPQGAKSNSSDGMSYELDNNAELSEEEMLKQAIALSMQASGD